MSNETASNNRLGILTISDSGFAEKLDDVSGDQIETLAQKAGFINHLRAIVPDEENQISEKLSDWCDSGQVDIIFTTGGTGLGPRDVTPQATKNVLDMEISGITEIIRSQTYQFTPFAMLSRATSGVRSGCLIVNLPGSPKGVKECLEVFLPNSFHALEMIRGWKTHNDPRMK